MVGLGEFGLVALLDAVAGGEYGVQRVACDVRGDVDHLDEADVVHVVEEGGGIGVIVFVEVKVEVSEEDVVIAVYGEGGDEVCDEVAEARSPSRWSVCEGAPDGRFVVCLELEV